MSLHAHISTLKAYREGELELPSKALGDAIDFAIAALAGGGEAVAWMLRRKRDGAIRGCDRSGPTKFMLECAAIEGDEYVPLFPHPAGAVQVTDEAVELAAYAIAHADSNAYSFEHYETLARAGLRALNPGGSRE